MEKTNRDDCLFCDESDVLETHHIVPSRFGGSDAAENLVVVCPTCHVKLERLYGRRFYEQLSNGDTDLFQAADQDRSRSEKGEDVVDVDEFVGLFQAIADAGLLERRRHYRFINEKSFSEANLRFRIEVMHDAADRYLDIHADIDRSLKPVEQYRDDLREQHDRPLGYVTETSIPTRFDDGTYRAVAIDLERATVELPRFDGYQLLNSDRSSAEAGMQATAETGD